MFCFTSNNNKKNQHQQQQHQQKHQLTYITYIKIMGNNNSQNETINNEQIQKGLHLIGDNNIPQEEKRKAFEQLRQHFCPVINQSQGYADELARVFALRFLVWDSPPRPQHAQIELANRIRGCIFGMALGDAVGVATEFLSKEKVEENYKWEEDWGPGREKVFCDTHRMTFPKGDWTDDTDQAIVLLQSLLESGGKANVLNFAEKIKTWMEEGFGGLGDESGAGMGKTTGAVLKHSSFKEDPLASAEEIWRRRGCNAASNGGVMRTAVCGIPFFWDQKQVKETTISLCKVTHADPRCAASCVVVTTIISLLLCQTEEKQEEEGKRTPEEEIERIIALGIEEGRKVLEEARKKEGGEGGEFLEEYMEYVGKRGLKELGLDEPRSIGHTFKALFSGVEVLRGGVREEEGKEEKRKEKEKEEKGKEEEGGEMKKRSKFEEEIIRLAMEGGDADTNGAVAGALLGCWVGWRGLPREWVERLPYFMWLEGWVEKVLFMLGLPVKISDVEKGGV